jgi:GDP-4-dehydro-6-deoxy-D-mannose reductase
LRNLITGINGFAASHLSDLLLKNDEEVFGIARSLDNNNISHLKGKVKVFQSDVRDPVQFEKIIREVNPQRIYHMASVSYVPAAAKDWKSAFETNVFGTLHLFEAIKLQKVAPRVMCVGSSEEYGFVDSQEMPISEKVPPNPESLYGVTKASAEMLAQSFFFRDGLEVLRVRPFNHTGPRQTEWFVCSSFAKQIAQIENDKETKMVVGNLEAERDFTDVRDTVRAYYALMQKGNPGSVYNVCSGKTVSIKEILSTLKEFAKKEVVVIEDPELFRKEDRPKYYGSHGLITRQTGWVPEILLRKTLGDLLEYWREKIKSKKTDKLG